MNFADQLRKDINLEVFSDDDLYIARAATSHAATLSGLSRSLKSQDIIKLKRGVYMFGDRLRRGSVASFAVAGKIYFPSYISFESALSYHGLIPEGVYVTTSACELAKKKFFETPLGAFSFDHVPCKPFFMGVAYDKGSGLVATPLKALFDLIYTRRKDYKGLGDLEADLRIEPTTMIECAAACSYKELESLARSYRRKNIIRFFERLVRETK